MLDKGSIDASNLDTKTNRDPRRDNKTGVISRGFRGFEDGTARIPIFVDTNGTIIGLGSM